MGEIGIVVCTLQAEDGIRDAQEYRGFEDVYKGQDRSWHDRRS